MPYLSFRHSIKGVSLFLFPTLLISLVASKASMSSFKFGPAVLGVRRQSPGITLQLILYKSNFKTLLLLLHHLVTPS
jgi:hypothetical protein